MANIVNIKTADYLRAGHGTALSQDENVITVQALNSSTQFGFAGQAYAVWTGSGLNFYVYWPDYYIDGVLYESGSDTLTLDAADGSNPRFDVIAVDSTGAIKITGTASADPVKPTVDSLTQLEITTIYVAAGATTPTLITDEDIYKENTEWTGSSNVTGADFADTTDPFAGTKHVDIDSFSAGEYVQFVDSGTHDISDFNYIKFYVKLKDTFSNSTGFILSFKNSTSVVSSEFTVTNGIYEFDRTDIAGYQFIVIPLTEFTFSSSTFDTLYIKLKGSNATGFRLDNVVLQGGLTGTSSLQNAVTTIQTPSGNAVSTQANDTFIFAEGSNMTITATGKTITFAAAGGGGGLTVQETAPGSPSAGDLWLDSSDDSWKLYVYYDSYWVEVGGSAGSVVEFWRTVPGTPTRTGNYTFTITDTGNANNYDSLLSRTTVLKWTYSGATKMAMVVSATYATDTVTVTTVGDVLSVGFSAMKYATEKARVLSFSIAGTLTTGTDLTGHFYAPTALKPFCVDGYHGTAGTTNATTYDFNDDGSTILSSVLSIASAATSGLGYTVADGTEIAAASKITVDCDSVSTTAPVDFYGYLFYFPLNNKYL